MQVYNNIIRLNNHLIGAVSVIKSAAVDLEQKSMSGLR